MQSADYNPSDIGIKIYPETHFGGEPSVLFKDMEDTQALFPKACSIEIQEGWELLVYERTDYQGESMVIRRNQSDLAAMFNKAPFNADQIGSIRILEINHFWPDLPEPFESGVVLFSQPGFEGDYLIMDGHQRNLKKHKLGRLGVRSVFVHPNSVAQLFSAPHFEGHALSLVQSDADLQYSAIGWDRLSSIIVYPRGEDLAQTEDEINYDPFWDVAVIFEIDDFEDAVAVTAGALILNALFKTAQKHERKLTGLGVTLFSDTDYNGSRQTFHRNTRALSRTWFGDNRLRSIAIPVGYEVTLYEGKWYRGRSVTLDRSCSNLETTDLGLDTVSSIRVRWVGF